MPVEALKKYVGDHQKHELVLSIAQNWFSLSKI